MTITHFTLPGKTDEYALSLYTRRIGERPKQAAELVLTLEDFDKDFFRWGGSMFVSERMRDVMALGRSEARFFEVDASRSAPLPRSKNYQIMQPEMTDDVSDPERSVYKVTRFSPRQPLTPAYIRGIALRPEAAPKHELFFDRFFSTELFCTDAFASRVLRGGCTGVRFVDPSTCVMDGRLCRTVRGIERIVDFVDLVEVTELVEAID
ncbi:MAG TPA: DUF1629 domain-containing protein [Caulobacteraceae bacterium]|nr:DUF1629 domain-containing protein [Caulobacteraceae bacterium]